MITYMQFVDRLMPPILTISFMFLALFVYTKLAGPLPFTVSSVTTVKSDTFQVTGEGKVTIRPDQASVTAGIEANGQTVKSAQDQVNSVINKISQQLKELGVKEQNIKTISYNISPIYDFSSSSQRISGYRASANLNIRVDQIDNINQVIDIATRNGANQISGVSFEIADKSKAENEAREKAVAEARKKAENASNIAGFKLGRVINYLETVGGIPPAPIPLRDSATSTTETRVEPGSNEITVNVTLSYQIL